MQKPVVVFDSSVLFSYVYKPAERYALLEALRSGEIASVTCPAILAELRGVALRYGIDATVVDAFLKEFSVLSRIESNPSQAFKHGIDSKDDMLFNLAIEQRASHLVSHDEKHVTAVGNPDHAQYEELRALAPALRLVSPADLSRDINASRERRAELRQQQPRSRGSERGDDEDGRERTRGRGRGR